ncbi:hypothetical protein ACFORL_09470 [Legionella dresdenensis]|uniref:Uncharacterized protein n=1 Tax=Legionella dresdenensis TaxID=450200 RepID=A0ABV8CG46_9GAMM
MIPIDELLTYSNTKVTNRYTQDYPNNTLSPESALAELLKFFWLSEKHKNEQFNVPDNPALNFVCSIHPEMKEIDDLWHTFLLFTQDYMDFCDQYFKHYIHHVPLDKEKNLAAMDEESYITELQNYLSYIYDNLGEDTVVKWFHCN